MKNRILVIDDDASVRESLQNLLRQAGYSVALAVDGQQGLARLEADPFDLLILDLDLPVICGWDVLDEVVARFPLLPVVVLSGFFTECEPGALAGADALIEKPPDVALLFKTLDRLLAEPPEERLRRLSTSEGRPAAPAVVPIQRLAKAPGGSACSGLDF